MSDAPVDSAKIVRVPGVPFVSGHPKFGGKKKGYKSTAVVLRELLQRMTITADGEDVTLREAALLKQIDLAIKEGDKAALTLILKQAKDFVADAPTTDPTNNNFYNIESFKQIINGSDLLELDEPDIIEEESTVVGEEPIHETESESGGLGGPDQQKI